MAQSRWAGLTCVQPVLEYIVNKTFTHKAEVIDKKLVQLFDNAPDNRQ
jgi:hypothetical protein